MAQIDLVANASELFGMVWISQQYKAYTYNTTLTEDNRQDA